MLQMIALAKKLEGLDPSEWVIQWDADKNISEQELNSVVITLVANCIYNHEKRPRGTTIREIAHSLQYTPKAEMLIGAYDKNDGEALLLIVKDTLTQSMLDDDMCPALTLGLYTAK